MGIPQYPYPKALGYVSIMLLLRPSHLPRLVRLPQKPRTPVTILKGSQHRQPLESFESSDLPSWIDITDTETESSPLAAPVPAPVRPSSSMLATRAYKPSLFSPTSLEGAGAAFSSYLPVAGFHRDHRQLTTPEASVPQQSLTPAGYGVGIRRADDKPRGRRRRRSSLNDVGRGDAGEQGTFFPKGLWI